MDEPILDLDRIPTPSSVSTRSVLEVSERIYDAAEHPERLRDALAALADITGAASAMLLLREGADRRLLAASHGPARVASLGPSPRTVPLPGGFELVLDRVDDSPEALFAISTLTPHLTRALRLGERLGARSGGLELKAQDLDRLSLGVVLIGTDGAALAINRPARSLLSSASSIEIEGHHLAPRAPASRALVETLVDRVISPPEPGRHFVGGRLRLPDATWGEVDLLVTRLDTRCDGAIVRGVALLSARGAGISPEARLREMFALDDDEASLAAELVVGREHPAGNDGKSAQAAVNALYAKLGTTRQSDLVRLLLRPPGVVFEIAERVRSV